MKIIQYDPRYREVFIRFNTDPMYFARGTEGFSQWV